MKKLLLASITLLGLVSFASAQKALPKKTLVKSNTQKVALKPLRTPAEAQALKNQKIAEKKANKGANALSADRSKAIPAATN